jgi:hypothetical protein
LSTKLGSNPSPTTSTRKISDESRERIRKPPSSSVAADLLQSA